MFMETYEIKLVVEVQRGEKLDIPLTGALVKVMQNGMEVYDRGGRNHFRGHIVKDSLAIRKIG